MSPRSILSFLNWPARVWGVLYFFAIPVYAFLYWNALPEKSFYHATLRYEPEIQNRSEAVVHELWDSYTTLGPDEAGDCAAIAALAQNVDPDSLRIDGDDVSFSGEFMIGHYPGFTTRIRPRIHFSLDQDIQVPRLPPGKGRPAHYKQITIENINVFPYFDKPSDHALLARCLFPPRSLGMEKIPSTMPLFSVGASSHDRLQILADAMRGFPPRDTDGFSRMLYLSASTITTAGFGDIVPVTRDARLAVTSESILGVFFIGLFLNAISRR